MGQSGTNRLLAAIRSTDVASWKSVGLELPEPNLR